MAPRIAVIGSTGLIGKHFLKSLGPEDYESVTAITRRSIQGLENKTFIKQAIYDFSDLSMMRKDLKVDTLVCALGTTIKTAGSQEVFMQVDHDIPLEIAEIAKEEGCQQMILISSVGANADSSVFYSKVKGQLEAGLTELGFKSLYILRPSLLLGDRDESRPGESMGKIFMAPLSRMIPWKYRPIHADTVAGAIHRTISNAQAGTHILEGEPLFR